MHYYIYFYILLLFPISIASILNGLTNFVNNVRLVPLSCPCEDPSLCQPIPPAKGRTRLAYSTKSSNWKYYDFTKITEIALFYDISEMDPQLICTAHKNNVQLHLAGFFTNQTFLNSTKNDIWIEDSLKLLKDNFLDGINIDYEEARSAEWEPYLVALVEEISYKMKNISPNYQLTYCLPIRPELNYDLVSIPKAVDYFMLMDYGETWRIDPARCYATASQQPVKTIEGLTGFLQLGIQPSKIVIGMPWFGFLYPCVNVTNDEKCYLHRCTQMVAKSTNLPQIYEEYELSNDYIVGESWDYATLTPFMTIIPNYYNPETLIQQYWYDNGYSLAQKADLYKHYEIRGVAAFHVDCLDYTIPALKYMNYGFWDFFTVFAN